MIAINEYALRRLEALDPPRGQVLRLHVHGNRRLGLMFGEARPDDQVVEREGREVVHISRVLSAALDGAILGISDAGEGGRLVLEWPGVRQR